MPILFGQKNRTPMDLQGENGLWEDPNEQSRITVGFTSFRDFIFMQFCSSTPNVKVILLSHHPSLPPPLDQFCVQTGQPGLGRSPMMRSQLGQTQNRSQLWLNGRKLDGVKGVPRGLFGTPSPFGGPWGLFLIKNQVLLGCERSIFSRCSFFCCTRRIKIKKEQGQGRTCTHNEMHAARPASGGRGAN